MSCNKCEQVKAIVPVGTSEAYDALTNKFADYHTELSNLDWGTVRALKKAIDTLDYVTARRILDNMGDVFTSHLTRINEIAEQLRIAINACLELPKPKASINFNDHVRKTYQEPTLCTCATCKFVVRADIEEEHDGESYVITKFACNYEGRLINAKLSGDYTKDEILEQLSVDEQGKCSCYEFGDQTDYDEIGDPLPTPGEPGVADTSSEV